MPLITSIKQQKNKNRVNVYLDGVFGFGIDLDNFVLLHLKVDQELTDKEINEIIKKAEFQKTWDKLLRFATLRPRSAKEINDYFRRKKVHESLFQDLQEKLKHLDLINDREFAKWWIEERQTFRPKSKRVLIQELKIKGIDQEIINLVLEDMPINEEKIARDLALKKEYKWKNLDPRKARQKISQYLSGKGFSWEVVEKVVSEMIKYP